MTWRLLLFFSKELGAVSYTHLDVYKRQTLDNGYSGASDDGEAGHYGRIESS